MGGSAKSSMGIDVGVPPLARHVHARVSAEGHTRVLLISSHKDIRRTISTFGARENALVGQEWRARSVLDRYRRWAPFVLDKLRRHVSLLRISNMVNAGPCRGRYHPCCAKKKWSPCIAAC